MEIILSHPKGYIHYDENFISLKESTALFNHFETKLDWKSGTIKIFGKEVMQPRLFAWYADENVEYAYSGKKLINLLWEEELFQIKTKIEKETGNQFNSCLANLYRNGNDSMGWHADNEKELGINPTIASLTLGQERIFDLKEMNKGNENSNENLMRFKIPLKSGSLLIMGGELQHHFFHQVAKSKKIFLPRINLTFRNVISA